MKTHAYLPCSELHVNASLMEGGALIDILHPYFQHKNVSIHRDIFQDGRKLDEECRMLVKTLALPCSPGDLKACLYYAQAHFKVTQKESHHELQLPCPSHRPHSGLCGGAQPYRPPYPARSGGRF